MIVGLIHSDSLSDISAAMENAGVEIQDENALEYFKLYRFHEGIREQGAFELFQKWLTGHAPESEAEFQEISRIYQENTSRQ